MSIYSVMFSSSVATPLFESSTIGFASVFPFKYTSVVLSGQVIHTIHTMSIPLRLPSLISIDQAMAGIFAAVASLISLAAASTNPVNSAYGYFGVALLVSLLCLISFIVMLRLVSTKSNIFVLYSHTHTHVYSLLYSITLRRQRSEIRKQRRKMVIRTSVAD